MIGEAKKAALHIWSWASDQRVMTIPLVEMVKSVAVTPNGGFCIAGSASGKLYIWQVCCYSPFDVIIVR